MYSDGYLPPILTVDSVIFQVVDGQLCVLLIKRAKNPFIDCWALPGGYNAIGETTREAMERTLNRKAGIKTSSLKLVEQLYTFDTVARDPRGHAVTITYMGMGKDIVPKETADTQDPAFFPVEALPDIAFDHDAIIQYAHQRLKSKITYTNAVFALLDPLFTLSQLQTAYEAILGRELDKRNFRKKFLSLELIHPTEEYLREGAHRPARLHRFNQQKLQILERSFD